MSVRLDPADYWRLTALQRAEQLALADARERVRQAAAPRADFWADLCTRYDLDTETTYRGDDTTCTLTPTPAPLRAASGD